MEKLPLFSVESEMQVLSGCLREPRLANIAAKRLAGDEFTRPSHVCIFEAVKHLLSVGTDPDLTFVKGRLADTAKLDTVGGTKELVQFAQYAKKLDSFEDHLQIVVDKALMRRLEDAGSRIIELVHNPDIESVQLKLEQASASVAALNSVSYEESSQQIGKIVKTIFEDIDAALEGGLDVVSGLSSGFKSIDDRIGSGFKPGCVYVVAARPAMGKTGLAMNIAVNVAKAGNVVHFASLEMPKEELTRRAMASIGKFPVKWTEGIVLNDEDYMRVANASEELYSIPLIIQDVDYDMSVDHLAGAAMETRRLHDKLDLLVVDYIQLMKSLGKGRDNRAYELEEISRRLKQLAKKLHIPIIVLAQVSRAVETRDNKRPTLKDLSDSSGIEKNADAVIFLYREEYYAAKEDGNRDEDDLSECEIIFAKVRGGASGKARLAFEPKHVRFMEAL